MEVPSPANRQEGYLGPQNILELPDKINVHILKELSLAELTDFCRVSQKCNQLASSDDVWRPLNERYYPKISLPGPGQKLQYRAFAIGIDQGQLRGFVVSKEENMRLVRSKSVDPNLPDRLWGRTVAHHAAICDNHTALQALCNSITPTDFEAQDERGDTPLLEFGGLVN